MEEVARLNLDTGTLRLESLDIRIFLRSYQLAAFLPVVFSIERKTVLTSHDIQAAFQHRSGWRHQLLHPVLRHDRRLFPGNRTGSGALLD
ncbi:hypothetical protein ZHAS_00007816 [Anopheles sinensis]|uniref:Uncharacterized protein n=1 Tax=Anopheles sinensis TaxID=74873 RepID=A0A084VQT3_ANOSI|nr:hypothetical protein ZHAS_00007816 [Anopheles sinensis]